MIFEELLTTKPLSAEDLQRLRAQIVDLPVASPPHDLYANDLNSTRQSNALALPTTCPVSSQTMKKMLMGGLCAFSLVDWVFNKGMAATHILPTNRYVLRALQYVPAGILISPSLVTSRNTLKKSILMVPSGLYLTWLESSEEEVEDLAF